MLRSIESNIRAFVKFVNYSKRAVEIHWINFRGENIHYTNLAPGESCMVRRLHCSTHFNANFFTSPRSTRTAHIRGFSFVQSTAKDCKSTGRTFSLPNRGSNILTRLTTGWFPLDVKKPEFISPSSHFAIPASGESYSSSNPKTIFSN